MNLNSYRKKFQWLLSCNHTFHKYFTKYMCQILDTCHDSHPQLTSPMIIPSSTFINPPVTLQSNFISAHKLVSRSSPPFLHHLCCYFTLPSGTHFHMTEICKSPCSCSKLNRSVDDRAISEQLFIFISSLTLRWILSCKSSIAALFCDRLQCKINLPVDPPFLHR
jgi:hypothetical protein